MHDPQDDAAPNTDGQVAQAGDGDVLADNPYRKHAAAAPPPDLDAAAPRLRAAEEQRVNRKALVFIGAIVVLLFAMGALTWKRLHGGKDAPAPAREVARTATPAAPTLASHGPLELPAGDNPPMPFSSYPPVVEVLRDAAEPAAEPATVAADTGPSLMERRMAAANAATPGEGSAHAAQATSGTEAYAEAVRAAMGAAGAQPPQAPRRGPDVEDIAQARALGNPDALLVRGSYLRCVLETRIITDVPGFTSCLVTEPVYSINGRTLLLPKGSKILGSYGGGPTGERVSVIWDRITTPNGLDVAMSSPGVDNLGGAGHPGDYSAHWGGRIARALMISLLADAFKYAAAENGPESTTVVPGGVVVQSPYESATARTMERLANDALSHRRPPTVTLNQGEIVTVYVARDVDFSAVLPAARR